ncbi:MAG: hypothetical protein D6766_00655 [Verrucomicrobia bacterium]|nr:MAG: hypothetical protein D6766_00655 [Verrucomicrobiota bacterium]
MSGAPAAEIRRWSWRPWVLVSLLVLSLEVSLVYVLSWRPTGNEPPAVRRIPLQVLADAGEAARLWRREWIPDAARLAVPGPGGFTGDLWRHPPKVSLAWPEPEEPPHWLEAPLGGGSNLVRFSLDSPLRLRRVVRHPPPTPTVFAAAPAALPPASRLEVQGELAGRTVLEAPRPPVWTLDDVLETTVVQVLVDERGLVLSAVALPPGSGLAEADARAVELARQVRFAPLPEGQRRLQWGRLVFHWGTQPASASTNAPPAAVSTAP